MLIRPLGMEDPRLLPDIWTVIHGLLPTPYTRARVALVCQSLARLVGKVEYPLLWVAPARVPYDALVVDASLDIVAPFIAVNGAPFRCRAEHLHAGGAVLVTAIQRRELDVRLGGCVTLRPCSIPLQPCRAAGVFVSFLHEKLERLNPGPFVAIPGPFSRALLRARLTDGMIIWPAREYQVTLNARDLVLRVNAGKGCITKDTVIDFVPNAGTLRFALTLKD